MESEPHDPLYWPQVISGFIVTLLLLTFLGGLVVYGWREFGHVMGAVPHMPEGV